ncbi:MAG: hypothetical protein IT195_13940 [Microthrixaceae bacterium]|nr:hypothetical protein [Microthrixaceae bacterium]
MRSVVSQVSPSVRGDVVPRIVAAPRAAGARKLGCLEELAFRLGHVTNDDLRRIAKGYPASAYRAHLLEVADG